ncbi:TRAP transporter small permease [Ammoniphilus sp. 3BR4]|uniref:TRAP transporter small permease n=1 Tax=Ammoniphilus sp. 3BR4 TaxID=3158265 RepID=UPI0034672A0D
MPKIIKFFNRLSILFISLLLALMCILVFGNVVLRYLFNSGITWSEEMARFLFVWLVFLGAILGLKDNEHLGVDMLVKKLSPKFKKVLYVISNLLILYSLILLLDGSWKLTLFSFDSLAPATGMPYSYFYGIGIVASIGMGIIIFCNLYKVLIKKDTDVLIMTKESEEIAEPVMKEVMK